MNKVTIGGDTGKKYSIVYLAREYFLADTQDQKISNKASAIAGKIDLASKFLQQAKTEAIKAGSGSYGYRYWSGVANRFEKKILKLFKRSIKIMYGIKGGVLRLMSNKDCLQIIEATEKFMADKKKENRP